MHSLSLSLSSRTRVGKHRDTAIKSIVAKDKNYSSNVFIALKSLYAEQFEGHLLDEHALGYLDEALDTATEYFGTRLGMRCRGAVYRSDACWLFARW